MLATTVSGVVASTVICEVEACGARQARSITSRLEDFERTFGRTLWVLSLTFLLDQAVLIKVPLGNAAPRGSDLGLA